jgi:hypothetical protein
MKRLLILTALTMLTATSVGCRTCGNNFGSGLFSRCNESAPCDTTCNPYETGPVYDGQIIDGQIIDGQAFEGQIIQGEMLPPSLGPILPGPAQTVPAQ